MSIFDRIRGCMKVTQSLPKDIVHAAELWNSKGNVFYRQGKHNEAVEAYDRAIKLNSSNAGFWNNKGVVLTELDRHAEAIECFNNAIKLNPANAEYWYNKGNALYDQREYNDAIKAFDETIKINPSHEDAISNRGLAIKLSVQEAADDAVEELLHTPPAGIDKGTAEAWYYRGVVLRQAGRYEKAVKCYNKAIELNPLDALA